MSMQQNGGNGNEGSPATEGSNEFVRGKAVKTDKSRRCWSVREETVMMAALKDLAAHGWKSDNGFRAGYLTRVYEAIHQEFPKSDLRVHPHIHSKLTSWKKKYYSLTGILNRSGVGFNSEGDWKIDCDDEQWTQIVQKDGNAKYKRNKSWPMYNDWKEIFGKDRAEGVRAVDTGDAVQKIYGTLENLHSDTGTSNPMTFEELFPDDIFKTPKRVIKKRKVEDKLDGVIDLMNQIREDTNERLKEIASRIGYEFELSTKRTEVFEQLKGIPELTLKQQFYASKKLVKEPELMDLFRGLHGIRFDLDPIPFQKWKVRHNWDFFWKLDAVTNS